MKYTCLFSYIFVCHNIIHTLHIQAQDNMPYVLEIKVLSYAQAARQGSTKGSNYWSGKEETGSFILLKLIL